jgi:hypothetical protein
MPPVLGLRAGARTARAGFRQPIAARNVAVIRRHAARFILVIIGALALPLAARAATPVPPVPGVPEGGGNLWLEGGWAVPLRDLAARIDASPQGAGAIPGFEVGMRWRFGVSPTWSLAPSMHYLGYGDATGLGSDGESTLGAASLRYGVEMLWTANRPGARLIFGVTPSLVHNRLHGPGKDHLTAVAGTGENFDLSARTGVRLGSAEISVAWHRNRFSSYRFFPGPTELDYNWDTVVLRFGWQLP